jgi:hypothetical protein
MNMMGTPGIYTAQQEEGRHLKDNKQLNTPCQSPVNEHKNNNIRNEVQVPAAY